MKILRVKTKTVKTSLCSCGCWRQVIYLWVPLRPGEKRYRNVKCFPKDWDGNSWYTGQVERHPITRPRKDLEIPAEDRLE